MRIPWLRHAMTISSSKWPDRGWWHGDVHLFKAMWRRIRHVNLLHMRKRVIVAWTSSVSVCSLRDDWRRMQLFWLINSTCSSSKISLTPRLFQLRSSCCHKLLSVLHEKLPLHLVGVVNRMPWGRRSSILHSSLCRIQCRGAEVTKAWYHSSIVRQNSMTGRDWVLSTLQ